MFYLLPARHLLWPRDEWNRFTLPVFCCHPSLRIRGSLAEPQLTKYALDSLLSLLCEWSLSASSSFSWVPRLFLDFNVWHQFATKRAALLLICGAVLSRDPNQVEEKFGQHMVFSLKIPHWDIFHSSETINEASKVTRF